MESLKFVLTQGAARLREGTLVLGNVALPTPGLLLYTQAGSVPHLTVDNVLRLLEDRPHPLLVPLQSAYCMRKGAAATGTGISRFCGFPADGYPAVQVIQDPLVETLTGYNDRRGVAIFVDGGKVSLTPEDVTETAGVFRPAAYQALTDGDTPRDCSNKRLSHSVKRSADYLDTCLRLRREQTLPNQAGVCLLASIQGGYNEESRKISTALTLERSSEYGDSIAGYIIDGFHVNGESAAELRFADVADLVTTVLAALPEAKPRFMFGCLRPRTVIELARAGIDCFDSSYACLQTEKNRASVYTYQDVKHAVEHPEYLQLDDTERYRSDMSVIEPNCRCYTCQEGFTRAYINHLLVTRELLAYVLLQMHNIHHMLRFFDSLREDLAKEIG